ncbi:hypothetical protein, variant [Spizellomyces punctatus DAOM BR117]|uniref:Sec1 family protein n=1 Tax=Spizellomyces punctatus (strain DAOM BR117) TaxID=645134 RepID=A0A0L0H5V4_SPIPD|nr:hypothetical protein, variant [Spizellomyces punctatus DAOM BR117]KNC96078.1 hypothetical protein, variant [Spizellomyces punctatus DAOM BR117]|eukprot:XP_016604118.1 hypothetical protein, variant [Spizellomyces punctatus DAOM BR117]
MQAAGVFSTGAVKDHARQELIDLLDSVRGKKGLVIDPSLSGPLSLVAEFTLLKEHGVEKIYHLAPGKLDTDCKSLIYICRPKVGHVKCIAGHIQTHSQHGVKISYSIFFVPRRSLICERVLEEEGVFGDVIVGEYHLDLLPLEDDLLSLELDSAFRELYLEGDTTAIFCMAKALMKLQTMFGLIPRIVGKGQYARSLADLLLRMRHEVLASAEDEEASAKIFPGFSEIDAMVVIDRTVDLITPMSTQLTYEGLIDEVFGIRSTFVELDPSMIGGPSAVPSGGSSTAHTPAAATKAKKVPLNSSDRLFAQLRDLNFAVVGGLLSQVARRIHEDYEGRHQARTVTQIKDFIGKLGNLQAEHQSLKLHTGIAEEVTKYTRDKDFNSMLEVQQNFVAGIISKPHIDYIEELIDKQTPLVQTLRLLSLYSLVDGGLKTKQYENFRRDIIQTYGHEHILTLQNLARVGILRKQDTSRHVYPQIRKAFRLIVDDVNEHQPNDISYVYSGYAPISVRLVQAACQKGVGGGSTTWEKSVAGPAPVGWKGWEEPMRLLPGPTFEEVQRTGDTRVVAKVKPKQKVTLIVFLGGCTFTEVSALRFLSQQDEGHREFIIATTNMISGSSMLKSLMANFSRAPLNP